MFRIRDKLAGAGSERESNLSRRAGAAILCVRLFYYYYYYYCHHCLCPTNAMQQTRSCSFRVHWVLLSSCARHKLI